MTRPEMARSVFCDALAILGACAFVAGLYFAWKPAAWLFAGSFLFWAAFVLRGRVR